MTAVRRNIAIVIGTRPEAIKMAPVILELRSRPWADVTVICTSQHRDTVTPILEYFDIRPKYDLDVMRPGQDLTSLTQHLMQRMPAVLDELRPDVVLAQGDTTTVFVTALLCFYKSLRFAHVEAGLRSGRLNSPFPEEFNRICADMLAAWHFVPTQSDKRNLEKELPTHRNSIFVTGNTVVDALTLVQQRNPINRQAESKTRLILVTLHRRENIGEPILEVLRALREVVAIEKDVSILIPVHPNPLVSRAVHEILKDVRRVRLIPPLSYPDFVNALQECHLVLTDSGGVQEEAPSFGKPVLIARDTTERHEAVLAGTAELVGTNGPRIVERIRQLLNDPNEYAAMSATSSPFGDGYASARIADILSKGLDVSEAPRAPTASFDLRWKQTYLTTASN